METVRDILMGRDGLTASQARHTFKRVKKMIVNKYFGGGTLEEVADILLEELGLELDYLIEFIDI